MMILLCRTKIEFYFEENKKKKSIVIQSEAKNLGYINVDVPEILRRFAPLNDKYESKII